MNLVLFYAFVLLVVPLLLYIELSHRPMRMPSIFIPHGGGPLPLLNDPSHKGLVEFLTRSQNLLPAPRAICVVSAHWEKGQVTIGTGGSRQNWHLEYDYYGFPRGFRVVDINLPRAHCHTYSGTSNGAHTLS